MPFPSTSHIGIESLLQGGPKIELPCLLIGCLLLCFVVMVVGSCLLLALVAIVVIAIAVVMVMVVVRAVVVAMFGTGSGDGGGGVDHGW